MTDRTLALTSHAAPLKGDYPFRKWRRQTVETDLTDSPSVSMLIILSPSHVPCLRSLMHSKCNEMKRKNMRQMSGL